MCEGLGVASPWYRSEALRGDPGAQLAVAEWIVDEAFPDSGLRVDPDPRGFRNFYERHFRVLTPDGQQCGFVAMGGDRQRGTMCLELTGAGCAHVKAWAHVAAFLDTMGARITRVDCAHDDFDGAHTLDDALRWHAAGLFNSGGRPPAVNRQGWDDGSGQTVYIGKNTGNQQLCVYEKGRQQGARDGDAAASWVRWEGRFGSKYRTIPSDVLTDPASYLVGHFPALRGWLQAVAMRMRTSRERAAANLASAVRHAKRQTGALFNLVKKHIPEPEVFGDWIAKHVVRDRLPAWLSLNPFGAETIKFAFTT
jgi:DNA relaxase NicK